MRDAYDEYHTEGLKVLEANRARLFGKAKEFRDSYEMVQEQSRHLIHRCDVFIDEQRYAFQKFLKESQDALAAFERLQKLSLALLLSLVGTLVVLVYRGMIAPLRTRLTESQAIIARQEKLASLGVLAAGVAHEIRNPLTAIKFRLFSLRKALPADGAGDEDATVIAGEITRLERIVKDFLQFARPSEPEMVAIPAARVIQEVHDLLKPQLEKNAIELGQELQTAAWVRMDAGQIKQVLINLIQNSAESIKRNGRITLRVRLERAGARKPAAVLIRGATGTGKELIARALYQHSHRADKPFIAVNCAAIPDTLLESELFGYERGAFTGAQARRVGRFEQAHGGTLFLDGIGDLNPSTQGKLLRVLQERTIQRLGSEASIPVDVRVLAATHRDLETAIKEREFREDLFYRLSVVTITLPALNKRPEDIPALARYFIQRYAKELALDAPSVQPEAIEYLQARPWPGNVRELENVIRQAMLLARPFAISLDHVQQVVAKSSRAGDDNPGHAAYVASLLSRAQSGEVHSAFARMIADLEPELYKQAIQLARGNQAKAARWLGVTRLKMREKLTQLGIHPRSDSAGD